MTPATLAGITLHVVKVSLPAAATTVMPSVIILRTATSKVVIRLSVVTPKLMFATAGPET